MPHPVEFVMCLNTNKKGRMFPSGPLIFKPMRSNLFAVAEELQQEHEHIDEIEVEAKGAHQGFFAHRI
jgi:hypothetical protein